MAYRVEDVGDDPARREEIIQFLAHFEDEAEDESLWRERLRFWWEDNPAFRDSLPRGWVLVDDGTIVGFLGAIAMRYVCEDQTTTALAATTWRVEQAHRSSSMSLFLRFSTLADRHLLLNTTPTKGVRKILQAMKYGNAERALSSYLPMRQGSWSAAAILLNPATSLLQRQRLPSTKRVVSLQDEFRVPPIGAPGFLRRLVDREYLDWYCGSPVHPKDFIGLANEDNTLSSYLVVTRLRHRTVRKCRIIDYHTWEEDARELVALLHHICRQSDVLRHSGKPHLLVFTRSTKSPLTFRRLGALWTETRQPHSYYQVPKSLGSVDKPYFVAEGDFGC